MAAQSPGTARQRKAVAAYFDAVRALDPDAAVAAFAPDALTFDPETEFPIEGYAELETYFRAAWARFERVDQFEEAIFFSSDGAAVRWSSRTVLKGGGEIVSEGIDVFEVNPAGTIQTLWTYREASSAPAQELPETG